MLLANHFAARMAFELNHEEIPRFSKEAIKALDNYSWPGNIRELKNLVERAVYRSDSMLITEIELDQFQSPYQGQPVLKKAEGHSADTLATSIEKLLEKPFTDALEEIKIQLLRKALIKAKYNQRAAAGILGLTYHQFRGLYRKYHEEID